MNDCANPECLKKTSNPSFCSRRCGAVVNNSLYPKRIKITRQCAYSLCKNLTSRKYCSHNCSAMARVKTLSFKDVTDGVNLSSNTLRKRLITSGLKEAKCETCSLEYWNDLPIPLELDHIDGNKHNNVISNLRILCANCHAQTSTYRGKNIGRYKRQ